MQDIKKRTAAVAAVMQYIKSEEEFMLQTMQPQPDERLSTLPPPAVSMWKISGRQAQMQMRNLMQIKTFR